VGLSELGRFSDPALFILTSLAGGEKHGYAMMEDIERLSGVRPGPGTLYGTINRLLADGLIVETTDRHDRSDDDERRRYYELTSSGRSVALDEVARLQSLVHRVARHLPGTAPA